MSAATQHIFWQWPGEGPTAKEFTPYTQLDFDAYPLGIKEGVFLQASDYSAGERRLVQPYETFGHQHLHTLSFEATTSAPLDLARYAGALPPLGEDGLSTLFVMRGFGYSRYGGVDLSGTVTGTIEYHYRASDTGYSAAFLAAGLLGLIFVRRFAFSS